MQVIGKYSTCAHFRVVRKVNNDSLVLLKRCGQNVVGHRGRVILVHYFNFSCCGFDESAPSGNIGLCIPFKRESERMTQAEPSKKERIMSHIPVTDTIAHALMQLVDDSNNNGVYREPSHADIEFHVNQAGLAGHDPKQQGQLIGKAKRVRAVLYAVMDSSPVAASRFASGLLAKVRACGGFREASTNYVGREAIDNAKAAFDAEGFVLTDDGTLSPKVLSSLHGIALTDALAAYARRAQRALRMLP